MAFTSSGPAFRKVCSQSMIRSTAAAKPVPRASVNWPSSAGSEEGSAEGASGRGRILLASAGGTTASETIGAATMPSATADWPSAIPIATASANRQRELASIRTSPP